MKTIAEITALKKSGQIAEALLEAEALFAANPRDYAVATCAAWVYVEAMKQWANDSMLNDFCDCIRKFKTICLPIEREGILYSNVLWAVRRLLAYYVEHPMLDKQGLDTLVSELSGLPINVDDAYRSLLSTAAKIKDWPTFPSFVEWWNLDNLRDTDYKKQEYEDKALMSLAETTYNALCRCMMACADDDKILAFVDLLDAVIAKHPDYQYLPYYQAKLLFKTGETERALEALKPFARKKTSDFWVWLLLGDEVSDDSQKMMFYCKAALCGGKDEMLVKMREQVGFYLIRNGKREMGKYLIVKVISTRAKENKLPSYDIQSVTREAWWNTTPAQWDAHFAEEQALGADEYLFGKMNQYEVLVTFVNTPKCAISFLTEDQHNGFFVDHSKQLRTIKENDVLQIAAQEIPERGITKVRRWKKVADRTNPHFYNSYSGSLRKSAGGFGFVGSVFVHASLANGFADRAFVAGTAVMAFDKKKQSYGWKAMTISPTTDGIQ